MIYLDNSATTQVDKAVLKATLPYFTKKYANSSSLHSKGREAKKAYEKARKDIAKVLKAKPEEIIFTSGGTESDNLAIKGVALANKGKHIITSKIEHPAITNSCKSLKGYKITYLDVNKDGIIDLKQLEKAINKDTVLVSIMAANNEVGSIQPIEEIGEICKKHKVLFHTDAVQAFTKIPINIKNIDLMSISSHKIHGPKGIGALYIKKGTKIKRQMDGGAHEFNLRAGTENVAGAVGFAAAAKLDPKVKYISELRDYLIKRIKEIKGAQLNGPENRLCNNVNFSFKGIEGEAILMLLNQKKIYVSTGSACASKSLEPSHVLLAMGHDPVDAHGSIRFSLSKFNNKKELDYVVKELKKAVKKLRRISPYGI
jgi:cysteine desulfurase